MTRATGLFRSGVGVVMWGALGLILALPSPAHALHGAAILKVCLGPGNTAKARPRARVALMPPIITAGHTTHTTWWSRPRPCLVVLYKSAADC